MPSSKGLFVLALVAVAGCTVPTEPIPTSGTSDPTPATYQYLCGGGHLETRDTVCSGTIADPLRSFGEPQLAVHASDPDVFAIAVSDGRATGIAGEGGEPAAEVRGIAVFATRDDGKTFARHRFPIETVGDVPQPQAMAADPALVYSPTGTLHLTGLIITRNVPPTTSPLETVLFHSRSEDHGATWSDPVVLDAFGFNDREWITIAPDGTLFISWRNEEGGSSSVAWSLDDGVNWNQPLRMAGCRHVSPVVTHPDGDHIVGCLTSDGGLSAHSINLATSESAPLGILAEGCGSTSVQLAVTPKGALVSACYYGTMAVSHDKGLTWSAPIEIYDRLQSHDAWPAGQGPFVFALAADPWGRVHLLGSLVPGSEHQTPGVRASRPVLHAVLDADTLAVFHEMEIKPVGANENDSENSAYGFADDFYDIEFANGSGRLVWTSDQWATEFAHVAVST